MKFTFGWLKEFLETDADAAGIAGRLLALGLEVEDVADPARALAAFTVARVREARPHPQADRLRVCTVETGGGVVEVVCGAPNARTGMMGVFAPTGTRLPGSADVLKKAKIRGVESRGMLVSERELGLSDNHDEIIELAPDAEVGAAFAKAAGLDDPVFDIAVTPNRPDCLGVAGIARDLAAAGVGVFRAPAIAPVPGRFASPIGVELRLDGAADACRFFVGRMVRGVRNGPSPEWLRRRLRAVGLRPISALVDITNYISLTYARPLHVFDADVLVGGIHVRLSRPGETLAALDGKQYALDGEVTVIADDRAVLAMGGVIGGEASGCTESTTSVFVESALFDPVRTAATGRRHQIESDARYRFERGVDPTFAEPGAEAATRLILELCGGEPSGLVFAGALPEWRRTVTLRPARVEGLGGLALPEGEAARVLRSLGFEAGEENEAIRAIAPPWRPDIDGEADLVEEVVRVKGFDGVPAQSMKRARAVAAPILTDLQKRASAARRILAARGLLEAVTWSFTSARLAAAFGGGDPRLALSNPISSELDAMRPSVLANLVDAVGRNSARGAARVALFEVGPAYDNDTPQGQRLAAAAVRQGAAAARHWAEPARPVDALDAKADGLAVLEACGIAPASVSVGAEPPAWLHPGRAGTLRLGPRLVLAAFGEVHPRILADFDVRGPVAACEVFLDRIPAPKRKGAARPPLDAPDLPVVERDFAFAVDDTVPADAVLHAAAKAHPLVDDVSLFDVFTGRHLPEGKKSLAIAVRIAPRERTLTDEQIDAIGDRIVAAVGKATGGALRS